MTISLLSNESEQSDENLIKIDANENRKYQKYWKCVNSNSFGWGQSKRAFIIEIVDFFGNFDAVQVLGETNGSFSTYPEVPFNIIARFDVYTLAMNSMGKSILIKKK